MLKCYTRLVINISGTVKRRDEQIHTLPDIMQNKNIQSHKICFAMHDNNIKT